MKDHTVHTQDAGSSHVEKPPIKFGIGESSLGKLIVGTTEYGICFIHFGENESSLVRALQVKFLRSIIVKDQAGMQKIVHHVVSLVDEPDSAKKQFDLDLNGTPLEIATWTALQSIPVGKTRTYKEIGQLIQASPQEVGEACAGNNVALVVPCHRVIRSDGSLAGFRWGIERKKALLLREQAASPDPDSLFAYKP